MNALKVPVRLWEFRGDHHQDPSRCYLHDDDIFMFLYEFNTNLCCYYYFLSLRVVQMLNQLVFIRMWAGRAVICHCYQDAMYSDLVFVDDNARPTVQQS
ncbi:hypothetical protein AVEN_179852-1 [Araneus ventricosus]|uniref:Uncharacterized protein n=1 Tax=Araneus ventricosus TaxID=182803 RepID=A0A4Y2LJ01_ARAVE|nr:hypothetical protein AVEN_179852-1 [Araneus ventricosus]